jgi:hypothetical protein
MNPKSTRVEKDEVRDTINYLDLLIRMRIPIAWWINEEHPGPGNRSHPRRKRGSDIAIICRGRCGWFEMKREKEYKFIMAHIPQLKANKGNQCRDYERYCDQIEFIEMIETNGGIAQFACSWKMVRDRLIKEGIDTTEMIYAGEATK